MWLVDWNAVELVNVEPSPVENTTWLLFIYPKEVGTGI